MKDTDIIAAIAPDAVSLMDKAIAEIKRLRQENATLTAERDEARRMACRYEASYNGVMFDNPKYSDAIAIAKAYEWDCFDEEGTK